MSTEVLGDMLVRFRADISDLTSKVKQVKEWMTATEFHEWKEDLDTELAEAKQKSARGSRYIVNGN